MLINELTKRIKTLQEKLVNEKLDAYIVTTEENIWYLTNITYKPEERPFILIIPAKSTPILIVPKLEEAHLQKIQIESKIITYWEYPSNMNENWFDVLNTSLSKFTAVGIELDSKLNIYQQINGPDVFPINLVNEMRMVKSDYEIRKIIKTAKLCDLAMGKLFESAYFGSMVVEPFILSRDIQKRLIQKKKFDPITTSLLTAVWPAPISAMPHSIPNLTDKMDDGPNVAMTYFRINGYAAECERTFFLSPPTEEEKEHFQNMMRARNLALSLIKPGMRCSDIDLEVKTFLVKKGYRENLLHRTGHGIGLGNHEAPWVAEGCDDLLQENMVISVEPGIYFHGVGGYRHSDTVLITKNGCECITQFPVELEQLTKTSYSILSKMKGMITQKVLKLS